MFPDMFKEWRAGMNNSAPVSDVLLLIIGLNCIVLPSVVHLWTGISVVLVIAGALMFLVGVFSIARDLWIRI
jgi:hypothetical protein